MKSTQKPKPSVQAPVASRKEAWVTFQMFVDDLRQMIG